MADRVLQYGFVLFLELSSKSESSLLQMDVLESHVEHTEHAPPLDGIRVSTHVLAPLVGMGPPAPPQQILARPTLAARMPPVPIPALGLLLARVIQDILAMERRALVR